VLSDVHPATISSFETVEAPGLPTRVAMVRSVNRSLLRPCLAILDRLPRRKMARRVAAADVEMFLPSFLNPYGTWSGLRDDAADLFAFELVKGNAHRRTTILAVMVRQQVA